MSTLELFCGTKSFSNIANTLGHRTVTLDIDKRFQPDIVQDILAWQPHQYEGLIDIDVLWASPPCQGFSVASIGKMWNMDLTPKHKTSALGLLILNKTVELIEYLNPKHWFIENPRGMMRRMPILNKFNRHTVTYCQYGDSRMKPTDIWTNCKVWTPKLPCKNGDPCHVSAPRGSRTGTQGIKGSIDRGRIPEKLFQEIFTAIAI